MIVSHLHICTTQWVGEGGGGGNVVPVSESVDGIPWCHHLNGPLKHGCMVLAWYCIVRARNNGRSMDNVRTNWGVDQSTFRLAGPVDRSQSIVLKMKSVVSVVISM